MKIRGTLFRRVRADFSSARRYFVRVRRALPSKPTLALIVLLLVIGVSSTLPAPSMMFVLSAQTESIDVQVVHVNASRIVLDRAWNEQTATCEADIEVNVEQGGHISYARLADGPLYITILGEGNWAAAGHELPLSTTEGSRFVIGSQETTAEQECQVPERVRLPANGLITVGLQKTAWKGSEMLLLLEGNLRLYSRHVGELFRIIPLNFGPFSRDAIYLASEIPIPPGSALKEAKTLQEAPAVWFGTVFIDMRPDGETAMRVETASNAQSLELWAPASFEPLRAEEASAAARSAGRVADVISLSAGSRVASDPNLRWIFGLIGVFALLFGLLGEIRGAE